MKYRVVFPAGSAGGAETPDTEAVSVELPSLSVGRPAQVRVDGREVKVLLLPEDEGDLVISIDGVRYAVQEIPTDAGGLEVRFLHHGFPVTARVESELDLLQADVASSARQGAFTVQSPLPGVVRRVLTSAGAEVEEDAPLFTLEAMKMENEVRAARRGRVVEVLVTPGQVVNTGEALARLEPV